jgi:predicted transcriptional regulator
MKRLTPLEEKIMLLIWNFEKCTVNDVLRDNPDLNLAVTTVSTVFRILEKNKFIRHRSKGRSYVYYPRISKEQYREYLTNELLTNYFDEDKELFIQQI